MENLAANMTKIFGATQHELPGELAVWRDYERALRLLDVQDYETALGVISDLLEKHPEFGPAQRQIELILEEMARQ